MGQAKRNGTFEERKAKAIERKAKERKEFHDKWKAQQDALTPEEKKTISENRTKAQTIMAMANVIGGSFPYVKNPQRGNILD